MKKKLISVALIIALVLGTYSVAFADGNTSVNATRNSLKSVGNVVYTDGENRVEIHSDDLYMLADKMDSFKECVADQLAQNHTYFSKGSNGTSMVTDSDIKVVHTQPSDDDAVDPVSLDFDTIMEGIAASQGIPSDVTEYGYADGTILYKTESGELTTDGTLENVQQIDISAAKPENLSAGSAAWVNGELILGTGSDNKAYYDINSNFLNKLDKKIKYINVQGNATASFFTSSEILPIMVSWNCWNPAGFSMGGVWDIMHCNSSSNANKNFQAQLGDGYKTNLTVTPLSAYVSSSSYTKASSGDEIIGWHFKGAGMGENKASVTVWYVECETPYYFDDIYPNRIYEKTSQSLYPIS